MKSKLLYGAVVLLLLLAAGPARAQTAYYVAPDGDDDNPGTIDEPRATVIGAQSLVAPGDTIYVRGGTYPLTNELNLLIGGQQEARIHLWAYPGETPVFDFEGHDDRGLRIRGGFWHVKGVVVQNAGDNGIHISSNDNIVEQVVVRYNGDSGLQMDDGASRNLILNVDSYENYDPQNNGENADGFAAKFDVGAGNVFRGCRAYRNSDDGFDMWNEDVAQGHRVTVEDSWAFENGINRWDDPSFDGDGNGYKLGHGTGAHLLVRVLTWGNAKHGIDVNGNQTGVTVYNSTGYANGGDNFYFDEMSHIHVLRNNVSHAGEVLVLPDIDDAYNTWNDGFSVSDDDFLSVDTTGLAGPRQPDGSLPETDFLRLAPSSNLVDAGIDVGLPFAGTAPDLGAFERDLSTDTEGPEPPAHVALLLQDIYPNPFTATTTITYSVGQSTHVRLDVFDVTGRRVATLVDESTHAGVHTARWNAASEFAAGIYLARLTTPTGTVTRTMVRTR